MANLYYNNYRAALDNLKDTRKTILSNLVHNIKIVAAKPIAIGNMEYFYITMPDGREVPAYRHLSDKDKDFLPIYDEDDTGEYGWSDFSACCRLFDVIYNKLYK